MIKNIFDHFSVLYEALLPTNPHLAAEHTLRQEEEVYKKSTKFTYRNVSEDKWHCTLMSHCSFQAVITAISNLKRRPRPDSISHASVGTIDEVTAREESQKKLNSLRLRRESLQHLAMSLDVMRDWGYIVDTPVGEGGSEPSRVGHAMKCERCSQPYMVKSFEGAEQCDYHWGRQYTKVVEGLWFQYWWIMALMAPLQDQTEFACTRAVFDRSLTVGAACEGRTSSMKVILRLYINAMHSLLLNLTMHLPF